MFEEDQKEDKRGNEENKDHNHEAAAVKEVIEEEKKGGNRDGEANEDLSSEATESKELTEEDKETDEKLKEATESRGTEEAYSNIGFPQKKTVNIIWCHFGVNWHLFK